MTARTRTIVPALAATLAGAACASQPAAGGACPGRDFAAFYAAFEADTAVQARNTRWPLEELDVVDAEPEPRDVARSVRRAEAHFPLVPTPAERAARGLAMRSDSAAGRVRVVLEKPDTDHQLTYIFERAGGGCWQLVRAEDHSL